MIGGPAFAGAAQAAVTLLTDADDTVGAAGTPGASPSTSVTVTVIVWSAVFARAPVPLVARTTTTYVLLASSSVASSKFGADLNVSTPLAAPIENFDLSAPPWIA